MDTKKIFQYSLLILLFVVSFLFYYKYFFKDNKKVEFNKSENIIKKIDPEINQNDENKNILATKALSIMNEKKITSLCVYERERKFITIGILHIHNILNKKIY